MFDIHLSLKHKALSPRSVVMVVTSRQFLCPTAQVYLRQYYAIFFILCISSNIILILFLINIFYLLIFLFKKKLYVLSFIFKMFLV